MTEALLTAAAVLTLACGCLMYERDTRLAHANTNLKRRVIIYRERSK